MATVLVEYNTEEQLVVRFFCGQKDSVQRIFIKKCFVFTVGSVCCLKQFTTLKEVWKSQMMKQRCGIGRNNSQKTSTVGFDALVMIWEKCIDVGGGYVEK
jgi:hypothetical protein